MRKRTLAGIAGITSIGLGFATGIVEYDKFIDVNGDLQFPVSLGDELFDSVSKAERIAQLPSAAPEELSVIMEGLRSITEPPCPNKENSDLIVTIGPETSRLPLCPDVQKAQIKVAEGVGWLVIPMTVDVPPVSVPPDIAETYEKNNATPDQCTEAVQSVTAKVQDVIRGIDPEAYQTKNVRLQIVMDLEKPSRCDEPTPEVIGETTIPAE